MHHGIDTFANTFRARLVIDAHIAGFGAGKTFQIRQVQRRGDLAANLGDIRADDNVELCEQLPRQGKSRSGRPGEPRHSLASQLQRDLARPATLLQIRLLQQNLFVLFVSTSRTQLCQSRPPLLQVVVEFLPRLANSLAPLVVESALQRLP